MDILLHRKAGANHRNEICEMTPSLVSLARCSCPRHTSLGHKNYQKTSKIRAPTQPEVFGRGKVRVDRVVGKRKLVHTHPLPSVTQRIAQDPCMRKESLRIYFLQFTPVVVDAQTGIFLRTHAAVLEPMQCKSSVHFRYAAGSLAARYLRVRARRTAASYNVRNRGYRAGRGG